MGNQRQAKNSFAHLFYFPLEPNLFISFPFHLFLLKLAQLCCVFLFLLPFLSSSPFRFPEKLSFFFGRSSVIRLSVDPPCLVRVYLVEIKLDACFFIRGELLNACLARVWCNCCARLSSVGRSVCRLVSVVHICGPSLYRACLGAVGCTSTLSCSGARLCCGQAPPRRRPLLLFVACFMVICGFESPLLAE